MDKKTMMMSDLIFKKGIKKLEAAFRVKKLSEDSLKIYFKELKDIDDFVFEQAVDRVITIEDFFPSIRCLLKYCGKEKNRDYAGRELKVLL
jgi:hypothetical protein